MPIVHNALSRSREALFGPTDRKRRVRTALIPACSRLSTADSFTAPKQLIRVDSAPVIHLLIRSLQRAGIERIVVASDNLARETEQQLAKDPTLSGVRIEWIRCKASLTRGQASMVMAAASYFSSNEPVLLISNKIYEQELLSKLVDHEMPPSEKTSIVALVDDSTEMILWAMEDHCSEFCKQGHCNVLVKVLLGDGRPEQKLRHVVRIAKKMQTFDALDVGAHLVWPKGFFNVLRDLLEVSPLASLVDALQQVAAQGKLRALGTGGLKWYSDLTIASLGSAPRPGSAIKRAWRDHAEHLLSEVRTCFDVSGTGNTISPLLLSQSAQIGSMPSLIELGETIGEGAQGRVIHGMGSIYTDERSRSYNKSLAVKMVRKGRPRTSAEDLQEIEDVELGDAEAVIMWEVHVLRELDRHDHIVRLMDVVDLVDSIYIVMERVDGPELTTYIELQKNGRLPVAVAQRIFAQLLQALHHAHSKGFLHCDVKPANVRLNAACERAVLTDWGYAQRIGKRIYSTSRGTPAYAAPELLTGYCSESFSGRRPLCPAVDIWALGVTLYQMVTGELPFEGQSMEELVPKVLRLNYQPPQAVPWECGSLIDSMLQLSPLDRADTKELLQSQWVKDSGALLAGLDPLCALCEEVELPAGSWQRLRPHLKKALTALFYLLICALLLTMHADEPAVPAAGAGKAGGGGGVAPAGHAPSAPRHAPATQTYESRANHR